MNKYNIIPIHRKKYRIEQSLPIPGADIIMRLNTTAEIP